MLGGFHNCFHGISIIGVGSCEKHSLKDYTQRLMNLLKKKAHKHLATKGHERHEYGQEAYIQGLFYDILSSAIQVWSPLGDGFLKKIYNKYNKAL